MMTSEIKQISEAQARDMAYKQLIIISKPGEAVTSKQVDETVSCWRLDGYIEQSAEEKFEKLCNEIEREQWAAVNIDIVDKIIDFARAAIREAKEGRG